MNPVEFVLWLNGAAELVGDQPPTPAQWATMREKLGEAVGGLVAARLLERAEETLRADERRKKEEAMKNEAMKQMLEMANMRNMGVLSGDQAQVDAYSHRVELETQKVLGLVHNPGLLNHILGKAAT